MGESILNIINNSLQSGEFPDSWKMAMETPIQKIPKTKKCEEFRPIITLKTMKKY